MAAEESSTSAEGQDEAIKLDELLAFERGRGDLVFSAICMAMALFFLVTFWGQTGWENRELPDDLGTYLGRQLGLIEGEGRLDRFGKILKQSWVAPAICLLILIPAAALNLRKSLKTHRAQQRAGVDVTAGPEVLNWLRALEFVIWFIAYTLLVPVLGYLVATLIFGTVLPWRMGYRSLRWFGICLATSFVIVLIFRSGLQIKTPVNIWLYDFLPQGMKSFMQTWF